MKGIISLSYWVRFEAYIKLFSSTLHQELLVNSRVAVNNVEKLRENTFLIHNRNFICSLSQKDMVSMPVIKKINYSEIIRDKNE
ncbi:hypothetical protein [Photorhabdus heterorhabditis]|uniref:Uncharacterized protein n=1 Tax=Photorhabdus heterorhabditis TaxID=880156 RepID=A0A5B0WB59_9GAMM|nr:hypothetical protein [Photorhabdus heterorhabditis]KAA1183159.1 hypothetical protein F0L16_16220 [Photorhabdus heterorhabditis]